MSLATIERALDKSAGVFFLLIGLVTAGAFAFATI
jgi:hypothetical protein